MASLLRSFLHGSHQVRLTQQVYVTSEIHYVHGNLDQITDVDNVVILLAYPGRSITATSSLRLSLLYLRNTEEWSSSDVIVVSRLNLLRVHLMIPSSNVRFNTSRLYSTI